MNFERPFVTSASLRFVLYIREVLSDETYERALRDLLAWTRAPCRWLARLVPLKGGARSRAHMCASDLPELRASEHRPVAVRRFGSQLLRQRSLLVLESVSGSFDENLAPSHFRQSAARSAAANSSARQDPLFEKWLEGGHAFPSDVVEARPRGTETAGPRPSPAARGSRRANWSEMVRRVPRLPSRSVRAPR